MALKLGTSAKVIMCIIGVLILGLIGLQIAKRQSDHTEVKTEKPPTVSSTDEQDTKQFERSPMEDESIVKLIRAGDLQQAKAVAEAKLKNNPDNYGLLMILGYIEAGQNNWETAAQFMQKAVQRAPQDKKGELMVDLGNIYALQGNNAEAQKMYREVLSKKPENIRAILNLGLLFRRSGESEKAIEEYQKALQLDPEHQKAIAAIIEIRMAEGRYEDIAPLARQLQSAAPDHSAGYYFEGYALTRQSKPDYPEAIKLLKRALEKDPKSKQALYTLSFAYVRNSQKDEALRILSDTISQHPNFFEAYVLMGTIALDKGDYPTAIQYLEQALVIKESPELYKKLAEAYFQSGQKEAGMDALTRSLEEGSPEMGKLLTVKGFHEYIGGDLEASENDLKDAVKQNPERYESRVLLVWNLLDQGRYKDAVTEAQEGVEQHPEDQKVFLNLLARAYLGQDMVVEAENALMKALENDPDFALTHLTLSAVYFRQGKYGKTESELNEILERHPEDLQARILLGRAYQAAGDNQKAEQHLLELLNLEPSDSNSRVGLLREMILLQIRMKNLDRALRETSKLIAEYPESTLGYLLKGQIYASMGNLPLAFDAIDAALEKSMDKRAALTIAAKLAATAKQYDKALRYLQHYRSEYGLQTLEVKYLYARALVEVGQYQTARDYIEDELPQSDHRANYLLGLSWMKERNLEKAEEYLELATDENSRLVDAFFDLARVKLMLGKVEQAVPLLENAIALNPGNEQYYLTLAQIYERTGEVDHSISIYEKGISELSDRPNSVPLLNNLALLYLKKDNTQQALSYANQVLTLAPEDPNVLDTVGWVYLHIKDFEKAILYLEQASHRLPEFPLFHYHLGLCYYEAGKLDVARGELEIALSKGEKAPWAAEVRDLLAAISKTE